MTVPASEGIFSFGPQSAKGTLASTWYRHKATRVNIGPQQVVQQFPPEIGGGLHPTGAFKQMAYGAGQAMLLPRLENVIGWLMYASVGTLSTLANDPEAGMYRHTFSPPSSHSDMKWMSVRREIPGATGDNDNIGDILLDCRVVGMRFALAPGGILTNALTVVGREPSLSRDGIDSWAYGNTYERYPSVPLAHQGSIKLGGHEEAATNLVVDLVNAYTTPAEEMIIGSPHPDDYVLQQQTLTVSFTHKWNDPDLFKKILTGSKQESGGKIAWDPTVYTDAFELDIRSPGNATGKSNPWRLVVSAPELSWQYAGPPELVGGGWLSIGITGVAQEQVTGDDFQFDLYNLTSAYAWPS